MTDQSANRIDQMLTRSLKHSESDSGLFTLHVHLPVSDPTVKVKILDGLVNKLIHYHLKRHVVSNNVVPLETLINLFNDGEKVMHFDFDGNDGDMDKSFQYLSMKDDRATWVDRTGNYIKDASEPIRGVEPIYIELNVIPQRSFDDARRYYARINKYVRKKATANGFLLINRMPQVLVNVNGKDAKGLILKYSTFHPKDIEDGFRASLNFEKYPLMLVNSSENVSSSLIRSKTRPSHVINIVDLDPNFIRREPLSTFGRSEVLLHTPSTESLLTISFGEHQIPDEVVQRINSTFFNINPYEREDRSVLIHEDDLSNESEKEDVRITWINDREISSQFANIDEILRSSDSILHDILLRSYRLRKLIAISVNDALSKVVLNEVLTGECELISEYKGLGSYYLPQEHVTLLKKLFAQLIAGVQRAYAQNGFASDKFDAMLVAPFIVNNNRFMTSLPQGLRQHICSILQINSNSSKILVCDHMSISEIDEHWQILSSENTVLAWIEPFFKSNHTRLRRNAIERRLARYDVQKHVLRKELLTQEKTIHERLSTELSTLKLDPGVAIMDLDSTSGEESGNDQTRFRIEFSNYTNVMSGSQRGLIRMQKSKWELLSTQALFDHFSEIKTSINVDHIDVKGLENLMLDRQSTQIVDWREKLRAKVEISSFDAAYQNLENLATSYDCRMVSKDWFSKDWLANRSSASIPNQKGLLLALGQFLSLDRHLLRTMQIQKLNEKLQQAEINRGLLLLIRDILNLSENLPQAKYYELAKRIMSSDHLGTGYQFFKKFIAISTNDDELVKELIELMSDVRKNVMIKKIKKITKL